MKVEPEPPDKNPLFTLLEADSFLNDTNMDLVDTGKISNPQGKKPKKLLRAPLFKSKVIAKPNKFTRSYVYLP